MSLACSMGLKSELSKKVGSSSEEGSAEREKVPRGCVAVLVGECGAAAAAERFVVSVAALSHPSMQELLHMAEQEFEHNHKGLLRIPCSIERFRSAAAAAGALRG